MFFVKHLFIVLDTEGSNILTISPSTALETVQLISICKYTSGLILENKGMRLV